MPTDATTSLAASEGPGPAKERAGLFSCVVDGHPRFHLEAFRWCATLTGIAGVHPSDIVVHVVGPDTSKALGFLRDEGVTVRPVDRFDLRSPHCNKISGAVRLAEDHIEGMAVLCDSDMGVIEDPRQLSVPTGAVAGKPVDAALPPIDVLVEVFAAADVTVPPTVTLPWGPDERTVAGNDNGGLYLVPGPLLPRVAPAWARWARWLLERPKLLGQWGTHVDQVSMALALAAEGIDSVPLDVRWNTPTHDLSRIPPDAAEPSVIHYHQEVDATGRVHPTGTPAIDRRIGLVNEAMESMWRRAFSDTAYCGWIDLVGTRSDQRRDGSDEKAVLSSLVDALGTESVLEVGEAPAEATRGLDIERCTAADLADGGHRTGADLVVCLDLAAREMDSAVARDLLQLLWRQARRGLVIRGFEDHNGPVAGIDQPLSVTLRQVAPEAELYPVAHQGTTTIFVVLRPPSDRHPRDFSTGTLAPLVGRHPDPLGLVEIRLHAWRTRGFFPDHAPRLWEYPVVAGLVEEHLRPGSRLVDVGAGVTPLAPFLSGRGYVVDTVDPSPIRRSWPPQPDWNEWDFLDYRRAGLAHRSWNRTLGDVPLRHRFDGAYSVSVIEHIPAQDRRGLLDDMSARVRPDGLVVLTIDLVRGSDRLWNRNRGLEVEDPARHGTMQDIIAEGARAGLDLFQCEVVRDWGDVGVDIGLLGMRRRGDRPQPRRLGTFGRIRSLIGSPSRE